MRIATWNLERRGPSARAREAQDAVVQDLAADVVVLTEPGTSYRSGPGIVTSSLDQNGPRSKEAWVAIVGKSVEPVALDIPFERMSLARSRSRKGYAAHDR